MADSSDLQPPFFGPELPGYPVIAQIVRVTGPAIDNLYPAFVQQFSPPLSFSDRESCLVFEPNGIALSPGRYDSRLVSSSGVIPIYATTCCASGSFSSSSSSSVTGS